ncbi:hypothetical protein vseg_021356 [Gypsophila vaccaria]
MRHGLWQGLDHLRQTELDTNNLMGLWQGLDQSQVWNSVSTGFLKAIITLYSAVNGCQQFGVLYKVVASARTMA